jgi:hypothetical protein
VREWAQYTGNQDWALSGRFCAGDLLGEEKELMLMDGKGVEADTMTFYYPIPAGAAVTCMHCGGLLSQHLDERGGWRGCVIGSEAVEGGVPVFLVTDRRRGGEDRRSVLAEFAGGGNGHGEVVVTQARQSSPPILVAGPRAAVYVAAPGTRVIGQTGLTAKVLEAIVRAGAAGKSGAELRKELKIKPKSLESILYRLRLARTIRSHNAVDVRG